jgi:hypothetical protein
MKHLKYKWIAILFFLFALVMLIGCFPVATEESAPTITITPTFCPPPTPEPLWVDPVISPTDQLTQIITVYIGYGVEVTVTTESGTYTMTGDFSAYTNPARVEINLLPNTINHVQVTAKVMSGGNGCTYSYTLTTTRDKNGNPLDIAQVQATP